ncbi:hypothetical protein CSUI_003626 [Cystoisospora suis]|uniref:Uncharacterized protein n=1 Tax=Cystoisospora suis TaxID=483139 RepID=A0A2C6L473_9APIC|nr:hypothetical protein CSUI_003626 [Cystoisospora suis]
MTRSMLLSLDSGLPLLKLRLSPQRPPEISPAPSPLADSTKKTLSWMTGGPYKQTARRPARTTPGAFILGKTR